MRRIVTGGRNMAACARFVRPRILLAACMGLLLATGCVPPAIESAVLGDIRPPVVRDAKLEIGSEFQIEFDEPVRVASEGFSVQPQTLSATSGGQDAVIRVRFDPKPSPGELVTIAGNVEDLAGNTTRVQIQFKGYNDRPAVLVISEVQTAKNTSKRMPHRDYIEFYVAEGGNLGGMFARWASSAKVMRYDFPACEVKAGDVLVVHCAPEGLAEEKEETADNLTLSGGIDATPQGRDFWAHAGGLPDAAGAIAVYAREGEPPADGVFYAESEKTGTMDTSKLSALAQELGDAGIWQLDAPATWDKALHWKPSTSRPLQRIALNSKGAAAWGVGGSGSQSPGLVTK